MAYSYKTVFRNIILISIILFGSLSLFSQSYINLDGALVFSTFKFTTKNNSDNITTPTAYSPITTNSFSLGYKRELPNGVFIQGAAELKKGGATLVYNRVNYAWNLQYTGLRAGIGYQYNKFKVRPYASVLPYFSYLLNAQQSIGLDVYDLKADNNIKKSDFGFYFAPGINIEVSRNIAIYAEYNYIIGLNNIETSSSQYLYNRASAFRLGISLNLTPPPRVYDTTMSGDDNIIATTQTPQTNSGTQPASGFTMEKNSSVNNGSNADSNNSNLKNAVTPSDSAALGLSSKISNKNKTTDTTGNTTYSGATTKSNYNNSSADSSKKQAIENAGQQFLAGNNSNSSSGNASQKNISDVNNNLLSSSATGSEQKSTQPYTNQNTPKTDKLTDSQLKNISKIASNKDIVFKIQISAVKNETSTTHFSNKNITGAIKKEKGSDGFTRFYVGTFKTYEKAKEELDRMKASGASTDGFIVAFKDAKKITVSDAVKLLK